MFVNNYLELLISIGKGEIFDLLATEKVDHVPHFLQLIKNLEYDTVYHEHVSYFGLKPLQKFFERFDMETGLSLLNLICTFVDPIIPS